MFNVLISEVRGIWNFEPPGEGIRRGGRWQWTSLFSSGSGGSGDWGDPGGPGGPGEGSWSRSQVRAGNGGGQVDGCHHLLPGSGRRGDGSLPSTPPASHPPTQQSAPARQTCHDLKPRFWFFLSTFCKTCTTTFVICQQKLYNQISRLKVVSAIKWRDIPEMESEKLIIGRSFPTHASKNITPCCCWNLNDVTLAKGSPSKNVF